MVYDFLTLEDVEVKNKIIFLRADINSPLDPTSKRILDATRIRALVPTLNHLKEAKVILGAHQSRPGRYDFTDMKMHSRVLQVYITQKVKYTPDIIGKEAQNEISNIKSGEVLVLNNVRMLEEENIIKPVEDQVKTQFVKTLSPLIDIFLNDAFAAAHRSQPSLVGLSNAIPMVAGRLMEAELQALNKVLDNPARPSVYLLGGAKVDDRLPVIRRVLRDDIADQILIGGLIRDSFHMAMGSMMKRYENLKEEQKKLVDEAANILEEFPKEIILPIDVALDVKGERVEVLAHRLTDETNIYDIGLNAIAQFSDKIMKSKTVVAEGPLGMFERRRFDIGTKEILRCMARCDAYTLIGGGHLGGMASMLDISNNVSHVSTGGGAMLSMLAGETLPVVEALEKSKQRYR
jgi:phosphoglycerate kinase